MIGQEQHDSVRAVFELRDAALAHGKALAAADHGGDVATRDSILATKLELEEKTIAAIDECSENATVAAAEATDAAEASDAARTRDATE